ncbi:MAG TPA: asparagine synthase-related protein, partial [Humisphaera sp.]|nr:asparagine synthase-related protein [Humisphaera sp.]
SSIYSGIRKLARGMWLRFTAGREEGDYYFWPNSGVSMAKAAAIELVASASRTTSRGGPQVVRDAFQNLLEGGRPRPPFSSGWRRTRTSALQKIPGLDSDPTQTTHNHFDGSPPDRQIVLETRATVIQAVHRQLVSDVPLGCFLSGGIDSSIIAAAARLAGQLQTFSIGFDDARYDETEYALAVASHLGTQHHEFIVRPDAAADLPKLAAVFGEPFADSSALPTHYLARETREHVKVALSGDGGDELFGGYERYRAIQASRQLDRLPMALRKWISHGGACLPSGHPTSFVSKLRRFLKNIDQSAGARYSSYLRIFDDDTIGKLLQAAPKMAPDFVAGQFEDLARKSDFAQAAMATDRVSYLPDDLLTKVDRASMLHALEVRSPFMDHELVHFAAGLTTDQLLKRGPKRMLREAFADDLPAWVFKRKKMGFAVPIGDWFRKELRPMLHDHLFATNSFAAGHFNRNVVERLVEDHETRRADHSQRLYALLMLELWWCTRRIK